LAGFIDNGLNVGKKAWYLLNFIEDHPFGILPKKPERVIGSKCAVIFWIYIESILKLHKKPSRFTHREGFNIIDITLILRIGTDLSAADALHLHRVRHFFLLLLLEDLETGWLRDARERVVLSVDIGDLLV
jgi:hypothetical protein